MMGSSEFGGPGDFVVENEWARDDHPAAVHVVSNREESPSCHIVDHFIDMFSEDSLGAR